MNTPEQNECGARLPSEKFIAFLSAVTKDARSFASCVRAHHLVIEEAIRNGVPLEAIAHGLSQTYGVRGSLAALKSALNRIRRMRDADLDRQWYDQVDGEQYGARQVQIDSRGSAHPMNGIPQQSAQGVRPYGIPLTQHLPGAPMPVPGSGHPYSQYVVQPHQKIHQYRPGDWPF